LLAAFALVESRARQPHVDLRLVTQRPFVNTNICMLAFGFAFFTAVYVVPQIAAAPTASGYGLALSTTQIGLLLVPACIAALLRSLLSGRIVDRVGPRAVVAAGAVCGIAGNLAFAAWHDSAAALAATTALVGAGWGLILPGVYRVVLGHASPDKSSVAV